jgi:DNA (cytosine-5)-methyltransferase 1
MAKVNKKFKNPNQPIQILDLFCGIGGASLGYARALQKFNLSYEITGVDNNPKLSTLYPFRFICADALNFLTEENLKKYDFIHLSPPCQHYSKSTALPKSQGKQYPDLLPIIKDLLKQKDVKHYAIENVLNSPLRPDLYLQGNMFSLKLLKKRIFELSFFMLQPGIPLKKGSVKNGDYAQVIGDGQFVSQNSSIKFKESKETVLETWKQVMQIPHATNCRQLSQAIPPAYTQFIFEYFIEYYIYKQKPLLRNISE